MWEVFGHVRLPAILRAPDRFLIEEPDPVITCCLTMRAGGRLVGPAKKAGFKRSAFFRFKSGLSQPPLTRAVRPQGFSNFRGRAK